MAQASRRSSTKVASLHKSSTKVESWCFLYWLIGDLLVPFLRCSPSRLFIFYNAKHYLHREPIEYKTGGQ